jgi:hypothetical protein
MLYLAGTLISAKCVSMIHGLLSKRKGREEYAIILEDKREPRLLRVKAGFDLANIFYFTDRPKSEDILQSRKHDC